MTKKRDAQASSPPKTPSVEDSSSSPTSNNTTNNNTSMNHMNQWRILSFAFVLAFACLQIPPPLDWMKIDGAKNIGSNHKKIAAILPSEMREMNVPLRGGGGRKDTEEEEKVEPMEPHVGKKTVLVTGAAGFIGSHVAEYLLDRGDDVIVVDEMNNYYDVNIKESNLRLLEAKHNQTSKEYPNQILSIFKCDITNPSQCLKPIFSRFGITHICHMAARAGVRPSIQNPYIYIHSNIQGTTRLLDFAVKYNITNFVYASSSSVYGGSKSVYFSEGEVVDHPISPYAASKKSVELLAYTFHHLYGIPTSGLRFFTVYGPRGRPDMAPYKFIDRISRGLTIDRYGDGSTSRDYTYVDDIVDGVVRSLDRAYGYQVFNLGKGHGTKLKDFIRIVEENTGKKAKVNVMPDQPGDVPYTCADVGKAQRLLGYKSTVGFEQGIKRTVEWYDAVKHLLPNPEDVDLRNNAKEKVQLRRRW